MYKKSLFVLCAMLMIGSAVQADLYYRATTSNSWSDLNNWYTDYTLSTNVTALPGTGDTVWTVSIASDWVGVTTTDYRSTEDPKPFNGMWATLTGGRYDTWTQQIVNVTENASSKRMRLGGGQFGTHDLYDRQNVVLNVSNSSTLTITDDWTGGRYCYSSFEMNIEAGSTVAVSDDFQGDRQYRTISNVSGVLNIGDALELDAANGWAQTGYLGDLYYDFGTYDNAGEATHNYAGGTTMPMDDAEFTVNILNGGLVTAARVVINSAVVPNGDIKLFGNGLLKLTGNQVATVLALKDAGWIYNGDLGDDSSWTAVYDGVNNVTNVYIPEPATMMLLGLGALGLIRRKK